MFYHCESNPRLEAIAYSLDNTKTEPAYRDTCILGTEAFVEMHLENCECTADDGSATTLAFESFHRLMVFDLMLANYNLQDYVV
jgi:hypothetical protein